MGGDFFGGCLELSPCWKLWSIDASFVGAFQAKFGSISITKNRERRTKASRAPQKNTREKRASSKVLFDWHKTFSAFFVFALAASCRDWDINQLVVVVWWLRSVNDNFRWDKLLLHALASHLILYLWEGNTVLEKQQLVSVFSSSVRWDLRGEFCPLCIWWLS